MFKPEMKKMVGCIGAAFAVYASSAAATITAPGGFAESFMHFTNFQLRVGDLQKGSSGSPLGTAGTSGTEVSATSAFLNGAGAAGVGCGITNLGVSYTCTATIGAGFAPGGALAPQTDDPLAPAGAGSAGLSKSTGDSRTGSAEVYLHSLSQLAGSGQTNASAAQDLFAKFTVTLPTGVPALPVELSFDMDRFLRAGLGQENISSFASSVFTVTVKRNGANIFVWAPNGDSATDLGFCTVGTTCFSFDDPFTLNSNVSVSSELADRTSDATGGQIDYTGGGTQFGHFESEVVLAGGFTYDIEIIGRATSSTRIPEPGSIALLGLGLLGLGAVTRKRQSEASS